MPHDRNGTELKVGDEVVLKLKIKEIQQAETYCNIVAESLVEPNPKDCYSTFSFNSNMSEKVSE